MDECVFCGIVAGAVESSVVAADDRVVAFLDILPVAPGHTLVVPRAHAVGLADLTPGDGAAMIAMAQRVAAAQRTAGLAEGVNLFFADGEVAGQEVFHAHLHVLARHRGDGMRLAIDYPPAPDRAELDHLAGQLTAALPGDEEG